MANYTLCNCLLGNIELDKKYITEVLMVFTQENPHKVCIDKSNRILEIYEEIAQRKEIIATWLNLMSMKPSSFEIIDIDISKEQNEENIFLNVCCSTKNQQKIIVNSHERWVHNKYYSPKTIIYNEIPIEVFDRDEAIIELNQKNSSVINAYSSVIAANQSSINETKNS